MFMLIISSFKEQFASMLSLINMDDRIRPIRRESIILSVILAVIMIFAGCGSEGGNSSGESATGKLLLYFPMSQSKTLLPDISMDPVSYDINGAGPNGSTFSVPSDQPTVELSGLAFGEWTVTVDAKNIDDTIIGHGEAGTTVHAGETSILNITVVPLDGTGTLDLTVNWTASDTETPSIESLLIPAFGGPIDLAFDITSGNLGTYLDSSIPAGFYTLVVKLLDGNPANITPVLTMGAVEVVRIVKDETTSGSFDFTEINNADGSIQVNITPQMNDPIEVTLSGQKAEIGEGESMTVTASVPAEVGNVTYVWYINGESVATGESYTVSGLPLGVYRLDVTAYSTDGLRAGSAACGFKVSHVTVITENIPRNGLVGEWLFDGNNKDSSGYNQNASIAGAVFCPDRLDSSNKALSFDGDNDVVTIPDATQYNDSDQYTVQIWINDQGSFSHSGPIWKGNEIAYRNYFYRLALEGDGILIPGLCSSTTEWTKQVAEFTQYQWHMITMTLIENQYCNYYVDSTLVYTRSITDVDTFPGSPINIGSGYSYFKGMIDNVRVYNRALSIQEITYIYNTEKPAEPSYPVYNPDGIPVNSGLIAYYPFNGNANDESGYCHHGQKYGVAVTNDRFGNSNSAYYFDGTDDYIEVPDKPDLNATTAFTVSAWARVDTLERGHAGIVWKGREIAGGAYLYRIAKVENTLVTFGICTPSTEYFSTAGPVIAGAWQMFTFSVTANGNRIFYINGVQKYSGTVDNFADFSHFPIKIGSGYQFFHGAIDDIRIYNRALSEAEIFNLYNLEKPY